MKLLLVNQHYPPDAGATGTVLSQLAEALGGRGHDVTVLTGRPSYPGARAERVPWRERRNGVRVERVHILPRRDGRVGRLAHYASFAVAMLARGLQLVRPDAIVAFSSTPLLGGASVRLLARAKRCPYLYVVQDAYPEIAVALGALGQGWRERTSRSLEAWAWRGASRVVVVGRELAELADSRRVPRERVTVIPNWVDTTRIVPQDISRFRRELGIREDEFVVEYAGNLGRAQALDTVLEAAERVARAGPQVRFLLVGDGSSAAEVRRRASIVPGVTCAPHQPEGRVADVLAAADLSLVPLKRGLSSYCVPSKVYSILASGRPVAAAVEEESEVARLVQEADCGFRVDPDDPASLAEEILRLSGDRSRAREMGRRGRIFCENEASLERAATQYEDVLFDLIPPSRNREQRP